MTWFNELVGFQESKRMIDANLSITNGMLRSRLSDIELAVGDHQMPTLDSLRHRLKDIQPTTSSTLSSCVSTVSEEMCNPANASATFQVASQFNLLEMVHPSVSPEAGVGGYESDMTQGPEAAIACGAATIYRNYFIDVSGQLGQTYHKQIDCAAELGTILNKNECNWRMINGYLMPHKDALSRIDNILLSRDVSGLLQVGTVVDSAVTHHSHAVSQVLCSALPIAYCQFLTDEWKSFASLILNAAYEATFIQAVINSRMPDGSNKLYLTLLGAGAFGNPLPWVLTAIKRAHRMFSDYGLDVYIIALSPNSMVDNAMMSYH